jgi:hypothetical protein
MKPKTYALAAAAVFAAETAFAIVHRALGDRYPSFTFGHAVVVDVGLAALWTLAALSMVFPHRASLVVGVLGTFASLAHGLLFCVATRQPIGVPFIFGAVLLAFCIKRGARAIGWKGLPKSHTPDAPSGLFNKNRRHAPHV